MTDEKERDEGMRTIPGDFGMRNKLREVDQHRPHVGGDWHAPVIRRQFQDFGIPSAVRDHANVAFKMYP